jgi:transposase
MKLADDIGLSSTLRKSFPDTHKRILSLAFFIAQKGLALSRCEIWSESHQHPLNQPISSQRVSDLLKEITENERQHFLSIWLKRLSENDLLCYDITSISSYATANEYVRWGYNRDNEKLPQINLAVLFGQKSGLPAYYRRLPGNISDVKTLQSTMNTLDFLGKTKLYFILDRGFYSEKNVDALLEKRYHFALAVPAGRLWVRSIIDLHYDQIASPERYRQTSENEALFMVSHLHRWGKRRCYLHLNYNAAKAAEEFDKLTQKLLVCKRELEMEDLQEANNELYDRFFIIKKTPKRGLSVAYNDVEIQKYRKRYAGFSCILTNVKTDSGELLETYRCREVVENCFDDLKNGLDMRRLRIHSSDAMDSRLFIQFLALTLICRIRIVVKQSAGLLHMTIREILEAMETIVRITYSGRYGATLSEIGPLQPKLLDFITCFGGNP